MINKRTFRQKLASYKRKPGSLLLLVLVSLSALITAALVISLVVYILVKGIPNLNAGLFAWEYSTENSSMMPALINTLIITLLSLLIAGPIGIFSCDLYDRIRQKGQQARRRRAHYDGNAGGNPLDRIRPLWAALLCAGLRI